MTHAAFSLIRSLALCLALFMGAGVFVADAQTESVIHSFGSGSNKDGVNPSGGLVSDSTGALYGLTAGGGAHNPGAIYRLSPTAGGTWKQNIIYSFTDGADGGVPYGSLLLGTEGRTLYGTASRGGALYGVVFELTHPTGSGGAWTETVLYTFTGGNDGQTPMSGVISNGRGTLYGTTSGGKYLGGVVFRLSPPKPGGSWTESTLYSFTGKLDGSAPSGLVIDSTGALYGTTPTGGQNGHGAVFKVSPPSGGGPWTETVLYSFTGGSDGGYPAASLIFDGSGALYGTTMQGGTGLCYTGDILTYCGTVFKLTPPGTQGGDWQESVLYSFLGGTDGELPQSNLVFDNSGALYGTAEGGAYGNGTVFMLTPPANQGDAWTEQILHSFGAPGDGDLPEGGVLEVGGSFYGATWGGGSKGIGTIFEVTP
jgi:uncharacterized repeat protein (TIGR03803 family)